MLRLADNWIYEMVGDIDHFLTMNKTLISLFEPFEFKTTEKGKEGTPTGMEIDVNLESILDCCE